MAEGIVVKIWNVSANSSTRSGASQIQSSIAYIENPEKVGVRIGDNTGTQVGNELSYVMNDMKTLDGLYVGCRHILDLCQYLGHKKLNAFLPNYIRENVFQADKASSSTC